MIRLSVFLASGAVALAGQVDFTPKDSYYLAETTKVPCVAFHNGSEDVSYAPPAGWKVSGSGPRATIMPPDKVQASGVMQVEPMRDPFPAIEANVKSYAERAPRYAPPEATKVTVTDSGMASLGICRYSLVEVTLTYAHFGQSYTMNILFMPYENQLLTFLVAARTADFPAVAKPFRASLFSIQGLDAPQKTATKGGSRAEALSGR